MNRIFSTAVPIGMIGSALVSEAHSAKAENGQITAGVAGGLIGGALLGGALASRPTYAAPLRELRPDYVEEPVLGWLWLPAASRADL